MEDTDHEVEFRSLQKIKYKWYQMIPRYAFVSQLIILWRVYTQLCARIFQSNEDLTTHALSENISLSNSEAKPLELFYRSNNYFLVPGNSGLSIKDCDNYQ